MFDLNMKMIFEQEEIQPIFATIEKKEVILIKNFETTLIIERIPLVGEFLRSKSLAINSDFVALNFRKSMILVTDIFKEMIAPKAFEISKELKGNSKNINEKDLCKK